MSFGKCSTRPFINGSAPTPSLTNTDQTTSVHVPPSPGELQRFIQRRRAQELGIELPMNLAEASEYVGASADQLQSMAEAGQIPAYRAALPFDAWEFYQTELDGWLRNQMGKERTPWARQ